MSSKPLIVVPAAGVSRRFQEKGILTPKQFIEFRYRFEDGPSRKLTMADHIVENLPEFDKLLVLNDSHTEFAHLVKNYDEVVGIPESLGQADTVYRGILESYDDGDPDRPLIVLNVDNLFIGNRLKFELRKQEKNPSNKVATQFLSRPTPNYSFIPEPNYWKEAVEKRVISNWAIVGAFLFESLSVFQDAYKKQLQVSAFTNGEVYLSETYNQIKGYKTSFEVGPGDVLKWDTPEQLLGDDNVYDIEMETT